MIIYQLHKYGGEWEDSFDYIIGSYLKKEKAEEEKIKAETEEKKLAEQNQKCNRCPFLRHFFTNNSNDLNAEYSYYCSEAKLVNDKWGVYCENYCEYWYESFFKIEEVEIEE